MEENREIMEQGNEATEVVEVVQESYEVPAVVQTADEGNKAVEIAAIAGGVMLGGLALYHGGKWVFNKVKKALSNHQKKDAAEAVEESEEFDDTVDVTEADETATSQKKTVNKKKK